LQQLQQQEGADVKRLSDSARQRLREYTWPGNVRELRNAIQRAWVMALTSEVTDEWLPLKPSTPVAAGEKSLSLNPASLGSEMLHIPLGLPLSEIERRVILATFEHCQRHKERTAAVLGISMKTLYNKLKEYQRDDG
jgi:DNA-binding NtrC family response regulator